MVDEIYHKQEYRIVFLIHLILFLFLLLSMQLDNYEPGLRY